MLQQGNAELARAKAQHLLEEDILGDVLEILEMHIGLILEHFNDLDLRSVGLLLSLCILTHCPIRSLPPSPVVVEAASSIIFAAPQLDCRGEFRLLLVHPVASSCPVTELSSVRDILIQRLGPDFARSAFNNQDGHVALQVCRDFLFNGLTI